MSISNRFWLKNRHETLPKVNKLSIFLLLELMLFSSDLEQVLRAERHIPSICSHKDTKVFNEKNPYLVTLTNIVSADSQIMAKNYILSSESHICNLVSEAFIIKVMMISNILFSMLKLRHYGDIGNTRDKQMIKLMRHPHQGTRQESKS